MTRIVLLDNAREAKKCRAICCQAFVEELDHGQMEIGIDWEEMPMMKCV